MGVHEFKPIDVRNIAATNKNLFEMVQKNEFRKDLFYRLKMGYVKIPPLRDRKSDLPLLIHTFVNKESNINRLNFMTSNFYDFFFLKNSKKP